MLAEILVFSLLAGTAVLSHVYRVFVGSSSAPLAVREFKAKLVETVAFGTAPAIVGILLGIPVVERDPGLHAVYLTVSSLFVLSVILRYAFSDEYFPQHVQRGVDTAVEVGTPLLLTGVSAILASTSSPSDALGPFCFSYLALFYFWVNDADGDGGGGYIPLQG